MAGRCQEQVQYDRESADSTNSGLRNDRPRRNRRRRSKNKRMCEAAMSPKIAITDSEIKSNDINVGEN